MSQIGRTVKNLEAPRPLKASRQQSAHHSAVYEVQSIEELITLTENVAVSLASGISNAESMNILLANLRIHGPQLEVISKDTLDRTFVTFRNASQDERLSIITRMNLLELIELRAKTWQNSDGINTYYKHKATDVQPENTLTTAMNDLSMLGTSPPSSATTFTGQTTLLLGPGELIRPSGKFTKPTKIPGKNYSKDEVVIRNADSGKVMGIKGRRVHMIEELSETIISFQRVNPGAKERLVQITGPNEEKINYAKQLIEDTIRRNASPVRLEAPQDGSCSSLASSTSDETVPRANRHSIGAMLTNPGVVSTGTYGIGSGIGVSGSAGNIMMNNFITTQNAGNFTSGGGIGGNVVNSGIIGGIGVTTATNASGMKLPRNSNGQMLLHSLSTNDASLGEYKYTVSVGHHNIKITGSCIELVRVAKLVLDDYFSSNEFLASVEAGAAFDTFNNSVNTTLMNNPTSATTMLPSPYPMNMSSGIPVSHQLISPSPFVDSGIGLNMMATTKNNSLNKNNNNNNNSLDMDDDVFIVENDSLHSTSSSSNSAVTQIQQPVKTPINGLTRSRRSHFSRKETTPDAKDTLAATTTTSSTITTQATPGKDMNTKDNNHQLQQKQQQQQQQQQIKEQQNQQTTEQTLSVTRIVHEYERMIYYAKSPHSWALPREWVKICEKFPSIVRNKDLGDEKHRFDADKYFAIIKSDSFSNVIIIDDLSDTSDLE